MSLSIKKILLMLVIAFCLGGNSVFAADNVLQAVQITGVNDSYNIVLKSDDIAEVKKTVQAPNKLVLLLKGIRASKTINTIYNNTASIDSVVVEPSGDEQVKILIQGANVGTAQVQFDSLKTPLGILGNSNNQAQNKSNSEITLSGPVSSFRPVYNQNDAEEEDSSMFGSGLTVLKSAKNALGGEKIGWVVTFGLLVMLIMSGMKLIKGKDNEIRIGLSQSLQDREIDLYQNSGMANLQNMTGSLTAPNAAQQNTVASAQRNISNSNYGLRSYQNGSRSPYATPEIQRPRVPAAPAPKPSTAGQFVRNAAVASQEKQPIQNMMQNTIQKAAAPAASRTTNIDSMKFLESMTKIYEKNGRTDLAQGLKSNIKKAQSSARG